MTNIIVADNHPITRLGMRILFESADDFQLQANVPTTESLFKAIEKQIPDIVILELDIPEINGIATIRRIKKNYPAIKVLIFSAQAENVYALSCVKAGAYGYLSKAASEDQILIALSHIKNGKIYLSNSLTTKLKNSSLEDEDQVLFRKLSSREIEVLKLLSLGKKNKEVAEGLELNEKTVSTYKARLMKKLNVTNIVNLLHQAKALELF